MMEISTLLYSILRNENPGKLGQIKCSGYNSETGTRLTKPRLNTKQNYLLTKLLVKSRTVVVKLRRCECLEFIYIKSSKIAQNPLS